LENTLEKIIAWHKAWLAGSAMDVYCFDEISAFTRSINAE
jgi:hypothetical protein